MKTVENQIVVRTVPTRRDGAFILLNQDAWWYAVRVLPKGALMLYTYLQRNQSGEYWALSRKDFMDKTGMSAKTYANAKKDLQDHGFLKWIGGNAYEFDPYGFMRNQEER